MNHPNATATAFSSTASALIYYVAQRLGWHGLTAEDAILAAGFINTAVLFVGKRGVKATILAIWNGVTPGK